MEFKVLDAGLIEFEKACHLQKEIFCAVKNGDLNSALILCRHYPVITIGRSGKKENIKAPLDTLKKTGIPVYAVERAGDVTYHGPGQITAYPVFNLAYLRKDIHFFLRQLEEVVIRLLFNFAIIAERRSGLTGAWVGNKKVASIGIIIKNWITYHGVSINIKGDDLDNFRLIRPCGMDIEMTSLETILDKGIDMDTIKSYLIEGFKEVFKFSGCSITGGIRYDESYLARIG